MNQILERLKNEPAFVGTVILTVVNGLWVFDVIELTDIEFGWLNGALILLFGAGVRKVAYGPKTGDALVAENELLREEFADQ
jgi:hypothetical protein